MRAMKALKEKLICWADTYETKDFIANDPIQFPRKFCVDVGDKRIIHDIRNVEISAFITSWLAYGNRNHIIDTAHLLHLYMGMKPYDYLMNREWEMYVGGKARLYRFYTYGDYAALLQRLYDIYTKYNTMEDAMLSVKPVYVFPDYIIALKSLFEGVKGVPSRSLSACKRLAMYLRWMVRRDSPVDMGVWEHCDPAKLIIPLDTHVHQQALYLGLTKRKVADMYTAREITDFFAGIYPNDPAKGDFALFGCGINKKTKK